MLANEKRASRLNSYETNALNKVSPAVTVAYKTRKEALPHEQVRTNFVEQPYKLRSNMGSHRSYVQAK